MKGKKTIAVLLAVFMVLVLLPTMAFAEDRETFTTDLTAEPVIGGTAPTTLAADSSNGVSFAISWTGVTGEENTEFAAGDTPIATIVATTTDSTSDDFKANIVGDANKAAAISAFTLTNIGDGIVSIADGVSTSDSITYTVTFPKLQYEITGTTENLAQETISTDQKYYTVQQLIEGDVLPAELTFEYTDEDSSPQTVEGATVSWAITSGTYNPAKIDGEQEFTGTVNMTGVVDVDHYDFAANSILDDGKVTKEVNLTTNPQTRVELTATNPVMNATAKALSDQKYAMTVADLVTAEVLPATIDLEYETNQKVEGVAVSWANKTGATYDGTISEWTFVGTLSHATVDLDGYDLETLTGLAGNNTAKTIEYKVNVTTAQLQKTAVTAIADSDTLLADVVVEGDQKLMTAKQVADAKLPAKLALLSGTGPSFTPIPALAEVDVTGACSPAYNETKLTAQTFTGTLDAGKVTAQYDTSAIDELLTVSVTLGAAQTSRGKVLTGIGSITPDLSGVNKLSDVTIGSDKHAMTVRMAIAELPATLNLVGTDYSNDDPITLNTVPVTWALGEGEAYTGAVDTTGTKFVGTLGLTTPQAAEYTNDVGPIEVLLKVTPDAQTYLVFDGTDNLDANYDITGQQNAITDWQAVTAALLPSSVTLNVTGGGTEAVDVAWACANYNPASTDPQTFTGTLTVDDGDGNPIPLAQSPNFDKYKPDTIPTEVTVTVTLNTVQTALELTTVTTNLTGTISSDKHYMTAAQLVAGEMTALGVLPTEIAFSDGSGVSIPVTTWTSDEYDPANDQTAQTFTATLDATAMAGYTFAQSVLPIEFELTLNVLQTKIKLTGFVGTALQNFSIGDKHYMTADALLTGEASEFPQSIAFTAESGPNVTVDITGWTCAAYDPEVAAPYTFTATLDAADYADYDLNAAVSLPENIKIVVTLTAAQTAPAINAPTLDPLSIDADEHLMTAAAVIAAYPGSFPATLDLTTNTSLTLQDVDIEWASAAYNPATTGEAQVFQGTPDAVAISGYECDPAFFQVAVTLAVPQTEDVPPVPPVDSIDDILTPSPENPITVDGDLLHGLEAGTPDTPTSAPVATTVADLEQHFDLSGGHQLVVTAADDAPVASDAAIGTGMKVTLYAPDGTTVLQTLTVIIKGDLVAGTSQIGDGIVRMDDVQKLFRGARDNQTLTDVQRAAGDVFVGTTPGINMGDAQKLFRVARATEGF